MILRLTPKQERFVQALISGLSQRQAYIKAGYSTKGKTDNYIDVEASKLFKNPKVFQRYQDLLNEHKEKALWTLEDSVNTLKWLIQQSMRSIRDLDSGYVRQGTAQAIIGAVKELNQLELLYPLDVKRAEKIDDELNNADQTQDDKIAQMIDKLDEAIRND